MEFATRWAEQRLWPHGVRSTAPVSHWLRAARFGYALLRDLLHGDLSLRAMSLVYATMLAIVPLLALAFALLKGFGFHRDLAPLLQSYLTPLGPRAGEITDSVVGFVDNVSGSTLASVSIVILLYSALSMAQKVESSFNFVWRVDRPRTLARRFSEYLSVMVVLPLLLSVTMGFMATLASTAAMQRLREVAILGTWLESMSGLLPYALVIASFSFLYVFVPNTRVRLVPAIVAGVLAGIVWAAAGRLFTSFVVSVSKTEVIYSSFAIVIVAMWWLYLSWLILLLGAQLAFYAQNPDYLPLGPRTASTSNSLRERLALAAMLLVGRDFANPGHGWRLESLAANMRVPRHLLEPVVGSLAAAGLLTRTSEQRLIPARDPRHIEVIDVLRAVRMTEQPVDDEGWNVIVLEVAASIEQAIQGSVAGRTLADLVDADAANARASGAAS